MEATFENKEFRRGFNSLQNFEGEGFVWKMCEKHAGTMQHLIYQTNHVDGLKHLCNKQYTWYTWYGAKKVTKG